MNRWLPQGRTAVWVSTALLVGMLAQSSFLPQTALADDPAPAPKADAPQAAADEKPDDGRPPARFLTVSGTIDERMDSRIQNLAIELQNQATQRDRDAFLVLEITRGSSKFGLVMEAAKFLTSARLNRVKTIAWVPERLDGYNAILALACKEIVMHPDAELGDIGRGEIMEKDEQQSVLALVEKRHNPRLSPAVVQSMMDPQRVLLKVSVVQGDVAETRVVTRDELDRLRENKIVIRDVQTIKEAGDKGIFTGTKARDFDFLVSRLAEGRVEVADAYKIPNEALRETPWEGEAPKVRLIKIDDVIEPVLETFIERQIARSLDEGVNLIIFEVNSYGGRLDSAHNLANAIADLERRKVRTVAWVPDKAISAAALISLACDEVYLTPQGLIGDIIPIMQIGPGQQFERAPEKALSIVTGMLQEIAQRKNRPPALAMAMADKDLKVYTATNAQTGKTTYMTETEIHAAGGDWKQGPMLPETGRGAAVTIGGARAHELQLASRPVQDLEELKKRLGIPAGQNVPVAARTWLDDTVFMLNTDAAMFLLLVIGIVCLYMELHLMTGLLGIVAAVCFSMFFWSRFLGGTAGWLEVMLFLLGVACIAMEVFIMPGFGVFGVSGGLLLFASLVMASQTLGNLEPGADVRSLSHTVGTLTGAVVSVVVIAAIAGRYLPSIPFLKNMILTPPGFEEAEGLPRLDPRVAGGTAAAATASLGTRAALLGERGTTTSMLRPAGKARIGDAYVDVVSDGAFIDRDVEIEVVQVEGNRIVVRAATRA